MPRKKVDPYKQLIASIASKGLIAEAAEVAVIIAELKVLKEHGNPIAQKATEDSALSVAFND